MKTRLCILLMGAMLALKGNAAIAAYSTELGPVMRPVNEVLTAMNRHDPSALSNAYAAEAVIVDDQAPYRWSGGSAPADWLSAICTYGKMHDARFAAFADPMLVQMAPGTAYVVVRGTLSGFGQRRGLHENAAITFSLRRSNGTWQITNQSWTLLPPGRVSV